MTSPNPTRRLTRQRSRSLGSQLNEAGFSTERSPVHNNHWVTSCDDSDYQRSKLNSHSSSSHTPKIAFCDDRTLDEYSNSVFDEESSLRDYQLSEFTEEYETSLVTHRTISAPISHAFITKQKDTESVIRNPLFHNQAAQSYLETARKQREVTIVNPLYRNHALEQILMSDKVHSPKLTKPKRRFFDQHRLSLASLLQTRI
jgi:hypothetical protein